MISGIWGKSSWILTNLQSQGSEVRGQRLTWNFKVRQEQAGHAGRLAHQSCPLDPPPQPSITSHVSTGAIVVMPRPLLTSCTPARGPGRTVGSQSPPSGTRAAWGPRGPQSLRAGGVRPEMAGVKGSVSGRVDARVRSPKATPGLHALQRALRTSPARTLTTWPGLGAGLGNSYLFSASLEMHTCGGRGWGPACDPGTARGPQAGVSGAAVSCGYRSI